MKFGDKCYAEIAKMVQPIIPKLLKQKHWSKCERRIIESWKIKGGKK